ncbi:MAG TPA: dihydroorotate dehydrogenase [Bacillota bacterium]|nr:dihydroorotate dehydrogenase [Bacillota bacterium]
MNKKVDLSVTIAGIQFRTPITTASGTFGFGREYADLTDLHQLGAITVKGITPEPRKGNPGQRLIETPAGLINSVGLMNPGVEAFLTEELPWLLQQDVPVIVNINGKTVEEYGEMAARLNKVEGIAALEVNISCPNVKEGGMAFGTRPETAAAAVRAARRNTSLPLIIKLSPNVTDIALMAKTVAEEGADAISLINTLLAMVIDIKKRKPILANTFGGLSGPAIRPIALCMVYQVYEAVSLPIIGMGGIMTAEDALSFIMAGASAIALGTANFVEPDSIGKVSAGLEEWCQRENIDTIREIIGCVHK